KSLVKNGTWVVPTLAALQAHAQLSDKTDGNIQRQRYLPASLKSRWASRRTGTSKRLGPADYMNYKRSFQKQLTLAAAMHRAGVRFLAGTDTGALDVFPGFSLHDELELLVRAGLAPMQALQAATRNPAQY